MATYIVKATNVRRVKQIEVQGDLRFAQSVTSEQSIKYPGRAYSLAIVHSDHAETLAIYLNGNLRYRHETANADICTHRACGCDTRQKPSKA